jgi:hypothetical protein
MLKLTESLIDDAKKGFKDAITKAKTENIPPSQWMSTKSSSGKVAEQPSTTEGQNRQQIASQLIEYPIIAIFTNAILTLFNELRLLAPIALVKPISQYLEAAHLEIAEQIKLYAAPYLLTEMSSKDNIKYEQNVLRSFASGYIRCCIPYLRQCLLDSIYADVYLEDVSINSDQLELKMQEVLPALNQPKNVNASNDDSEQDIDKKLNEEEDEEEEEVKENRAIE